MAEDFDVEATAASNFTEESIEDIGRVAATASEALEYPKAMLKLSDEVRKNMMTWVSDQLYQLRDAYELKREEWNIYEMAYKAHPEAPKSMPFVGASTDVIPLIASMIDPVHARLETGIFRQDPPFKLVGLRKSMVKYAKPLEKFINFYAKNIIDARRVSSPRLLELCKLGTCVFYVDYRIVKSTRKYYGKDGKIETETKVVSRGPVWEGVELSDFLFPALYQNVQDAPLVARRIRTSISRMRELESQGWCVGVDELTKFAGRSRTSTEDTHEESHGISTIVSNEEAELEIYEVFFRYDTGDGVQTMLRGLVHLDPSSKDDVSPLTILQLRLHDAWHGKYPFVLMNYTLNNLSLLGTGLSEMIYPFQLSVTRYHQLAQDNAFIANAKMFAIKRGIAGLEGDVKVYAGRTFYVEDPGKDIVPIAMGDIYPSTLSERQNILGLAEKRTGVSDYMVGRESPIIGSRATATSTLALIQEGTKRVEQVMENIRVGYVELHEMSMSLWAQYGVWDMEEYPFGSEEDAALVHEYFTSIAPRARTDGAFAVNIGVTDATTNRQVQQQMQLALIQVMQGYLRQLIELGQLSMQLAQVPQMMVLVSEVIRSAHTMFRDLLSKYDIPNAEEYLPDVLKLIPSVGAAGANQGGLPGVDGGNQQPNPLAGMDAAIGMARGGDPSAAQPTGEPQALNG